ncbi:MAG: hypothetical protein HYY18_13285 [Planctomycetes bacterium]|nr:hypothetical protein [Planctomycetota bacterium]
MAWLEMVNTSGIQPPSSRKGTAFKDPEPSRPWHDTFGGIIPLPDFAGPAFPRFLLMPDGPGDDGEELPDGPCRPGTSFDWTKHANELEENLYGLLLVVMDNDKTEDEHKEAWRALRDLARLFPGKAREALKKLVAERGSLRNIEKEVQDLLEFCDAAEEAAEFFAWWDRATAEDLADKTCVVFDLLEGIASWFDDGGKRAILRARVGMWLEKDRDPKGAWGAGLVLDMQKLHKLLGGGKEDLESAKSLLLSMHDQYRGYPGEMRGDKK